MGARTGNVEPIKKKTTRRARERQTDRQIRLLQTNVCLPQLSVDCGTPNAVARRGFWLIHNPATHTRHEYMETHTHTQVSIESKTPKTDRISLTPLRCLQYKLLYYLNAAPTLWMSEPLP